MNQRVQKALRPVVEAAIGRGCWEIEETRSRTGHDLRLRHSTGRTVPLHCSKLSEANAPKKLKSQLLRIERSLDPTPQEGTS